MANVYVVTNESGSVELSNLTKVAAFLGEKKVTKADIESGKYPMVTIMDSAELEESSSQEPTEEVAEDTDTVEEVDATEEVVDEPVEEEEVASTEVEEPEVVVEELDTKTQLVLEQIAEAINATPEDNDELFSALCELEDDITDGNELTDKQADLLQTILMGNLNTIYPDGKTPVAKDPGTHKDTGNDPEYPEVGEFKDEKAFKKYVKGLSDESVQEWAILEGAEWKSNEHSAINRMRMVMALKALHFPELAKPKTKKSKSKYGHYSTEELVQMAMDNDVEVPDDKGDARILRMYTIMALRKAGHIE